MSLRQSKRLLALVVSAHGLALLAVWFAALTPIWQIPATVVLTGSAIHYFRRLHKDGITALEADDSCYRLLDRGAWLDVQMRHALVTATLTVIEFKQTNGRRRSLVLLPDSLAADDYRRLRVWLRWVKPENAHESAGNRSF
ncbi:MAG: protein YgfX [Burkholderiales bacterium]